METSDAALELGATMEILCRRADRRWLLQPGSRGGGWLGLMERGVATSPTDNLCLS